MKLMTTPLVAALWALFLILLSQGTARADSISFSVSTSTSALTTAPGSLSGPFEIAFLLIDASGVGDSNNTVSITSLDFGGGSPGLVPVDLLRSTGGYSGNLSSGVTLKDSSLFNSFAASFTPGGALSFTVNMTTFSDKTLDPAIGLSGDEFGVFILDKTGMPISTTNECGSAFSGECALLLATIQSDGTIDILNFSATDANLAGEGGVVTTSNVVATPEPGTLSLLGLGFVALGLTRRRTTA